VAKYQIEYKKLGIFVAILIAITLIGYTAIDLTPEQAEEDTFNLKIDQEEFQPGETIRIIAQDEDEEPIEDVEVHVNNESIGTTNINGIAGYRTQESIETIQIDAQYQGENASLTLEPEDGIYKDHEDDTDDETEDSSEEQTEDETTDTDEEDTDEDTDEETAEEPEEEQVDEETPETGIVAEENLEAGTLGTITLYKEGQTVESAKVYIDGEEEGETTSSGTLTFTTPKKDSITISTSADIDDKTINIGHEEPETTLLEPNEGDQIETYVDQTTTVNFQYNIETTEETGIVTLQIGEKEYEKELDQGENQITEEVELEAGNYNWQLEVNTEEHTKTSSSRNLEITEVEPQEGFNFASEPLEAGTNNQVTVYNNDQIVTGETVYIEDESIGETNNNGRVSFEVPNQDSATFSTSHEDIEDETFNIENAEEEINQIEADFDEEILQGRENTIKVTGDGEPLEDTTVYANNQDQGQTNEEGELTFEIPQEDTITIFIEKQGTEYDQDYNAEQPNFDYNILNPVDTDAEDYKPSFSFDTILTDQAQVSLYLNNDMAYEFEAEEGENNFQEDFYVEEGQNEWYLEAEIGESQYTSETYYFDNSEPLPEVEININDPAEGEIIEDYGTEVSFETNTSLDYTFEAKADGKIFESFDVPGTYLDYVTEMNGVEPGNTEIEVLVIDDSGRTSTSDTIEIETTEEPPIADIELTFPDDGGPSTADERGALQYQIEAFEDVESRLYADGELISEETLEVEEGWLSTGVESITEEEIPEGTYQWYVEVESLENGETIQSEERTTTQ